MNPRRLVPLVCALWLGSADEPRPLPRADAGPRADVASRIDAPPPCA